MKTKSIINVQRLEEIVGKIWEIFCNEKLSLKEGELILGALLEKIDGNREYYERKKAEENFKKLIKQIKPPEERPMTGVI